MSAALLAFDLVKAYGDRIVLDGVSLTAAPGRRFGLIGDNGAGKSTLLRLLAGVEEPDAGEVSRPADIGFAHQELPHPGDATVGRVLDDALREVRAALRALDELGAALASRPDDAELLGRYGACLEWCQDHEAWDADRRAAEALTGLGVGRIGLDRRLDTLSGGQRSRLGLAALLVRRPGALLLDEPTNHLDDDAAGFLEERLRRLPGVVVAASHDRAFLDAVCTDLLDLDPALGGPTRYGGGFTDYLDARRAERARWEQRYAAEQDELAALRQAVAVTSRRVAHDRPQRDNAKMLYDFKTGRVQNQISRRVRNAQRRLAELSRAQVPRPPRPLQFTAEVGSSARGPTPSREGDTQAPPERSGGSAPEPAAALRRVRVPGRLAIERLDVGAAERLLVTGPNGAGKSTLLAVLAGRLAPADGAVHRRRGLCVGLLAQDTAITGQHRTARAVYVEQLGAERAAQVPLAELGLLAARDIDRPVLELSVGQRRRLELALLVARSPQLLLLDEPTNHLSPALAEELEEALGASPGAVVLASHDRWLRRRWCGRELHLAEGRPAGGRQTAG